MVKSTAVYGCGCGKPSKPSKPKKWDVKTKGFCKSFWIFNTFNKRLEMKKRGFVRYTKKGQLVPGS